MYSKVFHIESARVIPYYKNPRIGMVTQHDRIPYYIPYYKIPELATCSNRGSNRVFHKYRVRGRAKVIPYYKIRVSAFAVTGVWFTGSAVGLPPSGGYAVKNQSKSVKFAVSGVALPCAASTGRETV